MVIGMKYGRRDPEDQESKEKTYEKCRQFWELFEKEFGTSQCYQLIDAHLDKEEERQRWLAEGGLEKCADLVEKTALLLKDFINEI